MSRQPQTPTSNNLIDPNDWNDLLLITSTLSYPVSLQPAKLFDEQNTENDGFGSVDYIL